LESLQKNFPFFRRKSKLRGKDEKLKISRCHLSCPTQGRTIFER